jgi:hypothetical protein
MDRDGSRKPWPVGDPGLTDTPPVFGCTMPAESTGMSVPGRRAPSVRALGPTSGAGRGPVVQDVISSSTGTPLLTGFGWF